MIIAFIVVALLGIGTSKAFDHNKESKPLNHAREVGSGPQTSP